MYPEVYSGGERVAILNNITNDRLIREVNGEYIFSFSMADDDYKSEFIVYGNQIKVEDEFYDIKYIEVQNDITGDVSYYVECEHVFYRLSDTDLENYAYTGTPAEILADLLQGTDFNVGTVDYTDSIVFSINQTTNIMQVIIGLANVLGGEIELIGYNIGVRDTIGQDNGFTIQTRKNLQGIRVITDYRGTNKVSLEVDVVDVSNSDEWITLGLQGLETLREGDTVRVINEKIGVDTTTRVLRMERSVIKSKNLYVQLENNIDTFATSYNAFKSNAIKQNDIIYGIKINNEVGFEIERADKLARATYNADTIAMEITDGNGGYIPVLYFDPFEGPIGKFKLTSDVEIQGSITVSQVDGLGSLAVKNSVDWAADVSGEGKPASYADVTQTVINGGLVTTGSIILDDGTFEKAGITAVDSGDSAIRIFAGETFTNRYTAPFRVTQGGNLIANNADITGKFTSTKGDISVSIDPSADELFLITDSSVGDLFKITDAGVGEISNFVVENSARLVKVVLGSDDEDKAFAVYARDSVADPYQLQFEFDETYGLIAYNILQIGSPDGVNTRIRFRRDGSDVADIRTDSDGALVIDADIVKINTTDGGKLYYNGDEVATV